MPRVTTSVQSKARKKKIFKQTKGYTGRRKNLLKAAKETLYRALAYNYRDRKVKKREMRGLWITRISIAAKENGIGYSKFINGLEKAKVKLNRKVLADIAVNDKETFKQLVELAKQTIQ